MDKLMIHGYDALAMRMNLVPTTFQHQRKKDLCPVTARSCTFKKYDGCCVPTLGKIVFAQFWSKAEPINAFTVHGLWPSDCRTGQFPPNGCGDISSNTTINGAVQADPTLHQIMTTYWPTRSGTLWTDEWNKHGTCLSTVEPRCYGDEGPSDAIRYFKVSLALYSQFDIMAELPSHIVPGGNYTKQDFFAALPRWSDSLGLYCQNRELTEIRFSLFGRPNHQFSLRSKASDGSCPDTFLFPAKRTRPANRQAPHRANSAPGARNVHDELR